MAQWFCKLYYLGFWASGAQVLVAQMLAGITLGVCTCAFSQNQDENDDSYHRTDYELIFSDAENT